MPNSMVITERRTSVDDVFDYLHEQIATLELKPGDRISEAEIAAHFGVSRQPVRDAFSRLANLDLLLIRPQRATEVRRFSMRNIEKARFIRAAIEREVLRRAAAYCDEEAESLLWESLTAQDVVTHRGDYDAFGTLDYDFHKLLCHIARADYAFDVIVENKAKVDRMCMLGHDKEQRLPDLVADHHAIANAVIAHDPQAAIEAGMIHLGRLDETISRIEATNASYFEKPDT
ncbi:GntR family transcriptional regulator [Pseudooctadecabacter jejudonensis]|uniref:Putative HTH-type transcriptional regulator YdfH n=1 Tax=Pseudooctadecabacter jejudonensis TaxID=1391910 RepID=A0A1Y5TFU1_9RHOB|nr:GntR family transcriptional regulator [Pseudooctadecabacter jejudonensis]SLN62879.1 putative HTH-type transcriptional regulator YdfH [Pseudooctadecabacter jejudonensis]